MYDPQLTRSLRQHFTATAHTACHGDCNDRCAASRYMIDAIDTNRFDSDAAETAAWYLDTSRCSACRNLTGIHASCTAATDLLLSLQLADWAHSA